MSWLDDFLLAIKRVRNSAGENMPQRTALQFGSGFTLTDDPLTNATLVEGGGGGGGATGPTGPTGPAGATGATGAAGVAGQLPSGWAELPGNVGFSPGPTLLLSAQVTTETVANVWAAVSISWQTTLASSGAAFFLTLSNGINTYTSDETWSDATSALDDVAVSINFRTPVPVAAGTWTARVYGRRTKSLSALVCTHCDLTVLGMQGARGPTGAAGPTGATGATGPAGDITGGDVTLTGSLATVVGIRGASVETGATTGDVLTYTSEGTWSPQPPSGGITSGDVTLVGGVATVVGLQSHPIDASAPLDGAFLTYDASAGNWLPYRVFQGSDLTYVPGTSLTVSALQGVPVAAGAPLAGSLLAYDDGAGEWTAYRVFDGSDLTYIPGTSLTVTRIQGRAVDAGAPTDGSFLTWDAGAANWVAFDPFAASDIYYSPGSAVTVVRIQGRDIGSGLPDQGAGLHFDSGTSTWYPLVMAGDVDTTYPETTVVTGLRGRVVAATTPTTGQVLAYDGTQWAPSAPSSGITSGDVSVSSGVATVVAIQGDAVSTTNPTTGQGLIWGGASYAPRAPITSGDVSLTTAGAATVTALRNLTIASVVPTTGQVLRFDGVQWVPFEPVTMVFSASINMKVAADTLLGTTRSDRGRFLVTECWSHIDTVVSPGVTPPTISVGYVSGSGYTEFVSLQSLPNSSIVNNYYSQVSLRAAGTSRLSAPASTGIYCRVSTASNATTYTATIVVRGYYLTNP